MQDQLSLFETSARSSSIDLTTPAPVTCSVPVSVRDDFYVAYAHALSDSGAPQVFAVQPTYENSVALTKAMYDVIHEVAPSEAKLAIMSSAGKDSSACIHYYVESVIARIESGKRYVPAVVIMGSTGHEFASVAARQKTEMEALNRFCWPPGSGRRVDITAEIVGPRARDTVLVELIGNGLALPAKAKNDAVVQASISNWCVDRVKRVPLEAGAERASQLAPLVIQVLGTRFGESPNRDASIRVHSAGLPDGLTRMGDGENARMVGFMPIVHWEDTRFIRNFVVNDITSYRPIDGNLELDQIYRDASNGESTATECAVQRTADGGFGGGCSGLASATRLGCTLCTKASNKALGNLAEKFPKRYGMTYRLQQEINRHQELVHARPVAIKAAGFTGETMFPKGFTFRTRYQWLVMVFAAEIESGERQLTDDQLMWIERRWRRHGVLSVVPSDARADAEKWLAVGATGLPPCFFDEFVDFAGEFTESLGEGMPIGAFAAAIDPDQDDLNLAHLMGLGLTGSPVFPQVLAYLFTDRSRPDHIFTMVTDEPAVIGTRTNTGLLNGMVGATLRCIGVRPPTSWETKMADGRHLFYHLSRKDAQAHLSALAADVAPIDSTITEWKIADFLPGRTKKVSDDIMRDFRRSIAVTLAETFAVENGTGCGLDFEPLTDSYFRTSSIADLAGKVAFADLKRIFAFVSDFISVSETLSDTTTSTCRALLTKIERETNGDWSLLSQENDAGKAMRADIRLSLKKAVYGTAAPHKMDGEFLSTPALALYQSYVDNLLVATKEYRAGRLNTALLTRVAFIIRSGHICQEHAEEYTFDLLRWLRISNESLQRAA